MPWKKLILDEDPVSISDVTKVATIAEQQATASGNTQVIAAPGTGNKLRIKFIKVWNSGTADITVYLRFTSTGTARFQATLAAKTGFLVNLIACNWEGGDNEDLYVNLSAAGTIDVTALYTIEAV